MVLHGYRYSVYTRSVQMLFSLKGVSYTFEDVDPFDPADAPRLRHPFGRVPVLLVDEVEIYETQAILDYLDAVTAPRLTPADPLGAARMRQVMGIADSYVYWPLVRQVASQHVFHPMMGEPVDAAEFNAGVKAAPRVLAALEAIAEEGQVLVPGIPTLAECQLWPMLHYAMMVPQIAQMLAQHPHLHAWAEAMVATDAAQATAPDMEALRKALEPDG